MNKWKRRARKWRWQANEAIRELGDQKEALLAWQRGVREAWAAYDAEDEVEASTLDRLRQAIESEPKEET